MIKIAIVDDERFVHDALDHYIRHEARDAITIMGAAKSVESLIEGAPEVPDVVVLDVFLKNGTRLRDNIRRLREWGCAIVVISRDDLSPELRWTAKDEGALSFLNKDEGLATMRSAIESAAVGEEYLTPNLAKFAMMAKLGLTNRQEQIAALIAADLTNAEIAKQLHITEDVVKEHIRKIKERYQKAKRPVDSKDHLRNSLRQDGYSDDSR